MRLDVTWEPLPLSLEGERLICQAVFPSYEARISESARISGVSGQNMFSAPCYPLLRFDIILSRKGSTKRIQKGTEIQTVVFSHYFFSFRRDGYLYARFAEVKSEGKKVDWLFGWSVSCFSVFFWSAPLSMRVSVIKPKDNFFLWNEPLHLCLPRVT